MIKSFKHKGIEALFHKGTKKGINPAHVDKLFRILDRLEASKDPLDMNLPAYRLHELKGERINTWSVTVSDNWRVTFQFEGEDAVNVNYEDYH